MTDTLLDVGLSIWDEQPPDPEISRLVRHFGVEYEMFDRGTNDYCCDDCDGDRDDYDDNESPGTRLRGIAADRGLCLDETHDYHCDCGDCDPNRDTLMTAQYDCSVGIEFVSRILDVEAHNDVNQLARWVNVMTEWKDSGEWMPDGSAACGNHIHVSSTGGPEDNVFTDAQQFEAARLINAAYAAYGWELVADGGCGKLRNYNSKPRAQDVGYYSAWLRSRDIGTFEHRLWNTPRDPERLWVHVGLSIALTRWAFQRSTGTTARTSNGDLVHQFITHIDEFKRDVISHLPPVALFTEAAQVLNDHLVVY